MIKELTYKEAQLLRQQVLLRFRQGPFQGAGIRVSQYKKSYEPLAADIASIVKNGQVSVTPHRLRKLFYYTDPNVCEPDKLEKPSFGVDFIEAIFEYLRERDAPAAVAQTVLVPPPRRRSKRLLWFGAALSLLCAIFIGSVLYRALPEPWSDEFDSAAPDSLCHRGWLVLDGDSVALSRQLKPGFLTLYTYPGDFWVKDNEVPFIKNLLVRKLPGGDLRIKFRLVGFDPEQNWQQAGAILLNEQLDRYNFFRASFGFDRQKFKGYQAGARMTDRVQKLQSIISHEGVIEEISVNLRAPEFDPLLNEVGVLMDIKGKDLTISLWHGNEWSSIEIGYKREFKLRFAPAYVGLYACQGQTNEERLPLNADTIPAFFDYIRVEALQE